METLRALPETCTCTCTKTYTQTSTQTYTYTKTYTQTYTCTKTCTCTSTQTCTCTKTCTQTYTCTCTCTCTQTYTQTCTKTCTQTYTCTYLHLHQNLHLHLHLHPNHLHLHLQHWRCLMMSVVWKRSSALDTLSYAIANYGTCRNTISGGSRDLYQCCAYAKGSASCKIRVCHEGTCGVQIGPDSDGTYNVTFSGQTCTSNADCDPVNLPASVCEAHGKAAC